MPVLAGAFTCLISNMLYITSYQMRSLGLLVLSRFVLGFGAPHTHFLLRVRQMSGDYASQMHFPLAPGLQRFLTPSGCCHVHNDPWQGYASKSAGHV